MYTVQIHKTMEFLEESAILWRDLYMESEATLFQTYDWIINWWQSTLEHELKETISPYIVQIKDLEETISLIPMYIQVRKIKGVKFKVLKPMGTGPSDYIVPIISRSKQPDTLLTVFMETIMNDQSSWDWLEWGQLPEGSALDCFLVKGIVPKLSTIREITDICPFLEIHKSMEEISHKFDELHLKQILSKERKLNKKGTVKYVKVTQREDIIPTLNKLLEFHCKRWENTTTPSIYEQLDQRNTIFRIAESLWVNDLLHLSYLSVNQETIAVSFSMLEGNKFYYYLAAFNQEYKKFSPSALLLYNLIVQANAEGCTIFDFLRGDEGYKYLWGTKERSNIRYLAFNKKLKSLLLYMIKKISLDWKRSNRLQLTPLKKEG